MLIVERVYVKWIKNYGKKQLALFSSYFELVYGKTINLGLDWLSILLLRSKTLMFLKSNREYEVKREWLCEPLECQRSDGSDLKTNLTRC